MEQEKVITQMRVGQDNLRQSPVASAAIGRLAAAKGNAKAANKEAFRAGGSLPLQFGELISEATTTVGRDRLTVADDLFSSGLVYKLPNWIGSMFLYQPSRSQATTAKRTMTPMAGHHQRGQFDHSGEWVPIYATVSYTSISRREIVAAEQGQYDLEGSLFQELLLSSNEAIEDACINGASEMLHKGRQAFGLLDATNATSYVMAASWVDLLGSSILADVTAQLALMTVKRAFGPKHLYIPGAYGDTLQRNYSDGTTTFDFTIQERLEKIKTGKQQLRIVVADKMPADSTSMVNMELSTLDLIVGQQPTLLAWTDAGEWSDAHLAAVGCVVPRVKTDYNSVTNVVNATL